MLKAALALWALTVVTTATLPGTTNAKYTASATAEAVARVARWEPFDTIGLPVIGSDGEEDDGAPIELYFKRAETSRTTSLTLINRSEVAARYVFEADVASVKPVGTQDAQQAKQAFLDAVMASIEDNANYDGGIGLGYAGQPNATAQLTVTIPNATFQGLEIIARAAQID